jgi:hypothetical protein
MWLFYQFKIWISKNVNFKQHFKKMISDEKVMNIKVVELIKIYNFYFGHCFIQQSGSNIVHKLTYLSYSFINYVRDL